MRFEFVTPVFGTPFPVGLSARFSFIIDGLCGVLADHMSRERTTIPLLQVVWTMLRRRASRFARLIARFEAGTLAPARPRTAASAPSASAPGDARASDRPSVRLPRGEAWRLVRSIYATGVYDALLRHLLDEPEMARLLAAVPQAGRLLRPVLQMLSPHPLPVVLQASPRAPSRPPGRAPVLGQPLPRLDWPAVARRYSRILRSRFGPQIWA